MFWDSRNTSDLLDLSFLQELQSLEVPDNWAFENHLSSSQWCSSPFLDLLISLLLQSRICLAYL
jgi:hypothetical protein